MKKRKILFTLLSVTAMMFLLLGTVTQIQAQTTTTPTGFSGQAVGLIANADVAGGTAVVDARIADTGAFNQPGDFDKTVTVTDANAATRIQLGGLLDSSNTVSARVITTNTSGGPNNTPTANTSDSTATVNDLDFRLANTIVMTGVTVTATTVQSTSFCQCTNTGPRCTGTTTIADLRVNGLLVGTEIPFTTLDGTVTVNADGTITATPNSRISLLNGTVILTLNEQRITTTNLGNTQQITVNALRIEVNIPGLATTNVIVSQSTSDISCTVRATAAPVSISGRVISPFGRGIARARIFLTNSMGEKQTAVTNPFGYFSFKGISSGENYVVEITHKSYIFTPQVLLVTNDLTELNFTALLFGDSGGKSKFIPGN